MSLTPYIHPSTLTGNLQTGALLGNALFPNESGYDKREQTTRDTISNISTGVKEWSDEISNSLGFRSPMYKIGQIAASDSLMTKGVSKYIPDAVKGMVRAVSNTINGVEQEGIIIDGIGIVSAEIAVDMPSNSILYRSNRIIDQRVRTPNIVKMQVFVSNYLNDDIVGTLIDSVANVDPTGILSQAKNMFLNDGNTRGQQALYKLRYLQENGKPFRVYTPHGFYENMLIKAIRPVTNDKTMDMLYCEVEFTEILFYSPLGSGYDKIPARQNVVTTGSTLSGWTKKAISKVSGWL